MGPRVQRRRAVPGGVAGPRSGRRGRAGPPRGGRRSNPRTAVVGRTARRARPRNHARALGSQPDARVPSAPVAMRAHTRIHEDAGREAITLPILFLTVSLMSAVRVGAEGSIRFVGPTLLSLVLAVMLGALLLRAGVIAPERLVSSRRTALANANGSVVLLTLLFASAQVFTFLTPETGLMALLFSAFYFVLLWTTAAARPAARHLLRS